MEKETLKIIEEEIKKLLELLQVKAEVEIQLEKKEAQEVIYLSLQTENPGILIGYHGQTLASLQLIFNLVVYKKLGRWVRIFLNVGDWRQRREQSLKDMALKIAQRVEVSGEAVSLPYLSAMERRVIHLALKDHPKVATESQGEGEERRLLVKPKL